MTVIELKPEPNGRDLTVQLLTTWLERARSGEFIGCAILAVKNDGNIAWEHTPHVDKHKMIGAIEILKLDIAGVIK